jgi:tetratricopeptide (TPR) repeat protein
MRYKMIYLPRLGAFLLYLFLISAFAAPDPASGADDWRLLLKQGKQLLADRNYQAANQCLATYISHFPTDPSGYFWLGRVADDSGDSRKAINYYAKSLTLAKRLGMDSPELRVNLGNAVLKLNYLDEAIFDYQRAIEIDDKNMLAHVNLSKAFLLKGQYEKSLEQLSLCSQLGLVDNTLGLWRAIALKGLGRLDESKKEAQEYCENASGQDPPELKEIAAQL